MKKIIVFGFLVSICISVFSQSELTLYDAFGKFYAYTMQEVRSLNDGDYYTALESNANIVKYDYKTGKKRIVLFKAADFNEIGNVYNYQFSNDEQKILIQTDIEKIYRHSYKALYYIYDIKAKTIKLLHDKKVQLADFNPSADKICFMQDNNLFIKDLQTDKITQITNDGNFNHIINGAPDWVYEEEFGFSKAYFWNKDGSKIAYLKFDESRVKEFSMMMYDSLYPEKYTFKYPKAGEDNSIVQVVVYNLETKENKTIKIDDEIDIYIPRIKWTNDPDVLCITKMNRLQNHLQLIFAQTSTAKTKVVFEEKNKYYIDIHDNLTFLEDNSFIWTSENDGFNHLYYYDANGKLVNQITKGNWEVTAFYGLDQKSKTIYYQSCQDHATERAVYSIKLDGSNKKRLSDEKKGTYKAEFSKNFDYYINTYSNINMPYQVSVYKTSGKQLRMINDNETTLSNIKNLKAVKTELFSFKTDYDVTLNGYMIKPYNFDSTKTYPVFMFLYGGPGSQEVKNAYNNHFGGWFQMLASKGYMVVCVDNRGTGFRGEEFKKCTYKKLGAKETEDQIAAAKYIAGLPYTDKDRIGIFGWSYGGYMSSLCLFKGNDVFKMAIAVAPVTNWRYYDNIYTERYMQLPQTNGDSYDINSPINHVDKLKGKYLLIHGTADDNVHYQNSLEMVKALVAANKQFEMQFYPNSNHGIYTGKNTTLHLFTRMTKFIEDNL